MAVWRMGPHWIMLATAAAGAGVSGAAAYGLGAGLPMLGLTTLMGAASVGAVTAAVFATRGRAVADARFETLAQEMIQIREKQADTEARLEAVERKAQESPALVWRAATADIQVLGTLVSDLAKSVAEHDEKLAGISPQVSAPAEPAADAEDGFMLPRTTPPPASWFEDEAEPVLAETAPAQAMPPVAAAVGAAVGAAVLAPEPVVPSRAVVAELRSTLASALASERLEICLQPYVTLPQRRVAGYEAALALKAGDGAARDAGSLRMAARASGMTAELDRLLVERAGQVLRVLRARERSVAMTCAISGASLTDADFRSAVETVARAEGKLAQNLLLSVPLADVPHLLAEGKAALQSLARSGVSLGVHAEAVHGLDAAALERIGTRELRLPANALVGVDGVGTDIHPADLNELLERRNIRLLVTDIDNERIMRDLLDCAAAFGQGALFGASRPVRPEVLQPRQVADGPAAQSSARTAPEMQQARRQSFRSVLRRA
jgi:cyclic-di-GMP phosphodiesterase, flagellum assembly factor TipF